MKHKKLWSAFIIVFLAGLLIGAALGIVFEKLMHMPPRRFQGGSPEEHIAQKIGQDLQLSEEQKTSFKNLFKPKMEELHAKHIRVRNEVSNIIDESIAQISPPLSEDQKILLEKMTEERDRHFREEDKRGGPPGMMGGPPPPPPGDGGRPPDKNGD
jgi:Spy/CpxP family protein refolding chaperone